MMSADSVSCCCKEQGGLNGSKSRRFMVKMDPYSDASIIWLTDGTRNILQNVTSETIFAHSADSR